jgi:hypothetical protein
VQIPLGLCQGLSIHLVLADSTLGSFWFDTDPNGKSDTGTLKAGAQTMQHICINSEWKSGHGEFVARKFIHITGNK